MVAYFDRDRDVLESRDRAVRGWINVLLEDGTSVKSCMMAAFEIRQAMSDFRSALFSKEPLVVFTGRRHGVASFELIPASRVVRVAFEFLESVDG